MANINWTREDAQGEEETVVVPAHYEVCYDCEGEGSTLMESLRGAFTQEEFEDCFDDDESKEEYMRGGKGRYGVTCKTCAGRTTVLVPDEGTELGKEYANHIQQRDRERRDDERMMAMEDGRCGYND
jgi:hypothetical protein